MIEPVAIAILAKAPVAGLAKTRLIPALGAEGAAALQARFIRATLEKTLEARTGPVSLWCAPDAGHPLFAELSIAHPIRLHVQPDADLGIRMLRAIETAMGPAIVIGTDCPPIDAAMLRTAASMLRGNDAGRADVVLGPARDGGYGLIGMRKPEPSLFQDMVWSTSNVAEESRQRAISAGLTLRETELIWDVDQPEDLRLLADWDAART